MGCSLLTMQSNAEEEKGFLRLLQSNAELRRCRTHYKDAAREQHQQHSLVTAATIILQNCGSCSMPTGQRRAMKILTTVHGLYMRYGNDNMGS